MQVRFLGLLGLTLAVCLSSVLPAQDEQQRQRQRGRQRGGGGFGGPGGPGGFGFGGPRFGAMQGGGAMQLMGLLGMEEVRTEVGLSDEIWEAIPDESKRPDFRGMRDANEEERNKMFAEFNQTVTDTLDEVLDPNQQRRLLGLLAQQGGYVTVTNELIAKEIGLDEADIKKVRDTVREAAEEMQAEMREMFAGFGRRGGGDPGERPDRDEMRSKMEALMKKPADAAEAALTAEQKQKFEELKGEEFEFPERGRGFFGGRGRGPGGPGGAGGRRGPGGPGGGPGRGRRGGGDN